MEATNFQKTLPGGSDAFDSDLGTWAFSCFTDSHLDGDGVLGMDLVAEQAAERLSGPPDLIGFCLL